MFDKKTYREAVSSLHASGEILQEVKNMTHQKKKPFRLSRTIALAAVITTLCAVAAIAASGFIRYENPGAMLRAFFGKNVDSSEGIVEYDEAGRLITNVPAWERLPLDESVAQELVAPYLFAAGEQAVYGGYTLTVEAGLYDPVVGAGLLYCRVEHPDGVSGYEVFPDGELWWPEDAHGVQQRPGPLPGLGPAHPGDLHGEADVVQAGALHEQVELLEDHADAPPGHPQPGGGQGTQVHRLAALVQQAVDEDLAVGGPLQQVDAPDQGGLARAGHAHDAEDVPGGDGEAHVGQGLKVPVGGGKDLGNVFELDHGTDSSLLSL